MRGSQEREAAVSEEVDQTCDECDCWPLNRDDDDEGCTSRQDVCRRNHKGSIIDECWCPIDGCVWIANERRQWVPTDCLVIDDEVRK